jgi:uncharacterized repeat protein (TIGR03803 family)
MGVSQQEQNFENSGIRVAPKARRRRRIRSRSDRFKRCWAKQRVFQSLGKKDMCYNKKKCCVAWAWSRQLLALGFLSTVLYCVASPPSYQVLHVFEKAGDGVLPIAGISANSAGELFGTTAFGGANNFGSIFILKSSDAGKTWSERIIFSFSGNDGRLPGSALFYKPRRRACRHHREGRYGQPWNSIFPESACESIRDLEGRCAS